MRVALERSYNTLPRPAAWTYRLVGYLGAEVVPRPLAAVLAELPIEEADAALAALEDADLVQPSTVLPHAVRMGSLARLHAAEHARIDDPIEELTAACGRAAAWCIAAASSADRILAPHRARLYETAPLPGVSIGDPAQAREWYRAHHEVVMACLRAAAAVGLHEQVWRLTDAMWSGFLAVKPHQDWVAAHELGLNAARVAGNPAAELRMLTSGALGFHSAGRFADAGDWLHDASELAADLGADQAQLADLWNVIGLADLGAGELDSASADFQQARTSALQVGDTRTAALACLNLGDLALQRGRTGDAVEHARNAIAAFTAAEQDGGYERARAWRLLAQALYARGDADDLAQADQALDQATERFTQLGATHELATTMAVRGDLARDIGEPSQARSWYQAAFDLYQSIDAVNRALNVAQRLRLLPDLPSPAAGSG